MYNKRLFLEWRVIDIGRFFYQSMPNPPYFLIGSNETETQRMPLKVIINDSFTVIVMCRHSRPTIIIISNIVIFGIVVTVVIIFFKMTQKNGNYSYRTIYRQCYCGVKCHSRKYK